jgi:hypothetical protein
MAPGVEYAYPEDGDGGLDYAEAQDYLADLACGQDGKPGARRSDGVLRRSSRSSSEGTSSRRSSEESKNGKSSTRHGKHTRRAGSTQSSSSESKHGGTDLGERSGESERHDQADNIEIDAENRQRVHDRDRERKREEDRDRRHEHREHLTTTIADIKKRTQLLNQRRAEPHTQEP